MSAMTTYVEVHLQSPEPQALLTGTVVACKHVTVNNVHGHVQHDCYPHREHDDVECELVRCWVRVVV